MTEMTNAPSAVHRRASARQRQASGKLAKPFKPWAAWSSTIAVAIFLIGCAFVNIIYYLTGEYLDIAVAAVAAVAILFCLFPPPRKTRAMGIVFILYLVEFVLSVKNEPKTTLLSETIRSIIPVVMSALCFFAGASLRQRARFVPLVLLFILTVILYLGVIAASFGPNGPQKNIMGGTMFELSMLMIGIFYTITGKMSILWGGAAGGLILFGAILTDHRMMMAIACATGMFLIAFTIYKARWFKAAPPIFAVIISVFTLMFFTSLTTTSLVQNVDNQVKAESGRTAMSGRQVMWGTIIDAIAHGPKIGYGPTIKAEDLTDLQLSTHNGFLQVGLQSGLIGVFLVICIFGVLATRAITAENVVAGGLLSLLVAGVIIHNSSENVLFTNNFPIAALGWLNLGFYYANTHLIPLAHLKRSAPRVVPFRRLS